MRMRRAGLFLSALLLYGCDGGGPSQGQSPNPSTDASKAAAGVEPERCSEVRVSKGDCVVLGVLAADGEADSDDTERILRAQRAFWGRVNEEGGIGGVVVEVREDVDADEALAFLGTSEVDAPPLADLPDQAFVAGTLPASSRWLFEDRVLQTGASECIQAMDAVEVLVFRGTEAESVAVVHLDDELGRDAAAGARLAAQRSGYDFTDLSMSPGDDTDEVIETLVSDAPDIVVLATSPEETKAVVLGASERGVTGKLITTHRGWDSALLEGDGADTLTERLVIASPWREFTIATTGHSAMRASLGDVEPDNAYTAGWIGNYPMLELLRSAQTFGDLTRSGLGAAARRLEDVDYDGMYPPAIGTPFSGGPNSQAAIRTAFEVPDPDVPLGTVTIEDYFNGLTVALHDFDQPCFAEE